MYFLSQFVRQGRPVRVVWADATLPTLLAGFGGGLGIDSELPRDRDHIIGVLRSFKVQIPESVVSGQPNLVDFTIREVVAEDNNKQNLRIVADGSNDSNTRVEPTEIGQIVPLHFQVLNRIDRLYGQRTTVVGELIGPLDKLIGRVKAEVAKLVGNLAVVTYRYGCRGGALEKAHEVVKGFIPELVEKEIGQFELGQVLTAEALGFR